MAELESLGTIAAQICDEARTITGNRYDHFECLTCFNSGWREVYTPALPGYMFFTKCFDCRYWEFDRQKLQNRNGSAASVGRTSIDW